MNDLTKLSMYPNLILTQKPKICGPQKTAWSPHKITYSLISKRRSEARGD